MVFKYNFSSIFISLTENLMELTKTTMFHSEQRNVGSMVTYF